MGNNESKNVFNGFYEHETESFVNNLQSSQYSKLMIS